MRSNIHPTPKLSLKEGKTRKKRKKETAITDRQTQAGQNKAIAQTDRHTDADTQTDTEGKHSELVRPTGRLERLLIVCAAEKLLVDGCIIAGSELRLADVAPEALLVKRLVARTNKLHRVHRLLANVALAVARCSTTNKQKE